MSELYVDGKKIIETSETVGDDTGKVPTCKAVNDLFVVEVKTTETFTMAANSSKEITVNVAKTGYTPIMAAPRGLSTGGWSWTACELIGNSVFIVCNSFGWTSSYTGSASFSVLYRKNV